MSYMSYELYEVESLQSNFSQNQNAKRGLCQVKFFICQIRIKSEHLKNDMIFQKRRGEYHGANTQAVHR